MSQKQGYYLSFLVYEELTCLDVVLNTSLSERRLLTQVTLIRGETLAFALWLPLVKITTIGMFTVAVAVAVIVVMALNAGYSFLTASTRNLTILVDLRSIAAWMAVWPTTSYHTIISVRLGTTLEIRARLKIPPCHQAWHQP